MEMEKVGPLKADLWAFGLFLLSLLSLSPYRSRALFILTIAAVENCIVPPAPISPFIP